MKAEVLQAPGLVECSPLALRSVSNATRQDARDFLRLAGGIPIRPQVEPFPLEEANQALLLLKEGKIQGAGVLAVS